MKPEFKLISEIFFKHFSDKGKSAWCIIVAIYLFGFFKSLYSISEIIDLYANEKYISVILSIALFMGIVSIMLPWATTTVVQFFFGIINGNKKIPDPFNNDEYPYITIQIPVRNEPFEIVCNHSLKSALSVDYPKEKLTIQVIDNSSDGNYEELEYFCNRNGISFIHRKGSDGGKARNLNIGLGIKSISGKLSYGQISDLYFLIDADVSFPSDILKKTSPEFRDEKLPFIIFEADHTGNDNFFNYSLSSINKAKSNIVTWTEQIGFVSCGGYGLLYRGKTWKEIGGWKEDFVGEDWATGIFLRANFPNWSKGKRINYIKVTDIVPKNLERFKIQQKRWAKGAGQATRNLIPTYLKAKHIPWNEKIDCFYRYSFGYASFSYLLAIVPFISLISAGMSVFINEDITVPNSVLCIYWKFFLFIIIINIFYSIYLFLCKKNKTAIKNLLFLFPSMVAITGMGLDILKGYIEGLLDKERIFNVTPKNECEENLKTTVKNNCKEIIFGLSVISATFILPASVGYIKLIGFGFVISPFMSLLKTGK